MNEGLENIIAGVEDSGFGRLLTAFGGILPILDKFVDGITTGSGAPIRFSDLFNKPGSLALRVQRAAEKRQYRPYSEIAKDISENQSDIAIDGLLKSLGYRDQALTDVKGTLGVKLASMGFNAFLNPWDNGLGAAGRALYKRQYALMSGDNPAANQSIPAQLITTRRVLDAMTEDFNASRYGTLSMTDMGAVASKLISTGKFDAYYSERYNEAVPVSERAYKNGVGADRVDAIRGAMRNYSRTLEKMKDVLGGDMSEVLSKMDQLFGGTAIAMQSEKLDKISTAIRHASIITGMTPQDLARSGAVAATYIMDVGGSQLEALGIGTNASYYAAAGINNSKVSADKLKEGVIRMQANEVREGTVGTAVAAYMAWKNNNPNDNKTFSEFMAKEYKGPKTTQGFMSYMNTQIDMSGVSDNRKAALREYYLAGEEARDIRDSQNVAEGLMRSRLDDFVKTRRNTIAASIAGLRDREGNAVKVDISSIIGNGYDNDVDTGRRLAAALRKAGVSNEQDILSTVQQFRSRDAGNLEFYTGIKDKNVGYQILYNKPKADALRNKALYAEEFKDLLGSFGNFIAGDGELSIDTLKDNIAKYLNSTGKSMDAQTAINMLSGVLGINLDAIDKLNLNADFRNKLMGRIQGFSQGTSILMGYRNTKGAKETESAEADKKYIERSTRLAANMLDAAGIRKAIAEKNKEKIATISGDIESFIKETQLTAEERGFYTDYQTALESGDSDRIDRLVALSKDDKAMRSWLDNRKKVNKILSSKYKGYNADASSIDDIMSNFYMSASSTLKAEISKMSKEDRGKLTKGQKLGSGVEFTAKKEYESAVDSVYQQLAKEHGIKTDSTSSEDKKQLEALRETSHQIVQTVGNKASAEDILTSILTAVRQILSIKESNKK